MATRASSPAAPSSSPVPAPALQYEDAIRELEGLVGAMEAGQLPLDELITQYRRGAELLNFCRDRLESVEQQVKVLEDSQLKPWSAA